MLESVWQDCLAGDCLSEQYAEGLVDGLDQLLAQLCVVLHQLETLQVELPVAEVCLSLQATIRNCDRTLLGVKLLQLVRNASQLALVRSGAGIMTSPDWRLYGQLVRGEQCGLN